MQNLEENKIESEKYNRFPNAKFRFINGKLFCGDTEIDENSYFSIEIKRGEEWIAQDTRKITESIHIIAPVRFD